MSWFDRDGRQRLWRGLRRNVFNRERVREAFTYNLPLKLLSILLAFSLWFFVNFGERDTEESLKVPLELRNIPAHLMITSPRLDFVDLRVSGPRTLLGRIDRNRVSASLDLNGVRPGPAVFRVDAEALPLPRGVKVVRMNPAQVTLELERVAHKSVPVHVRLVGKPPPDFEIADTKVSPETVLVTGPASDVEDVHAANTEPIDVSEARVGAIEREVPLDPAGEYLSFSANRAAVQVRIEEMSVTRELRRLPVQVHNAEDKFRVVPDQIRLSVRGPKRLVNNLELERGAVYINAQGEEAGEHEVKPTVELPAGVELVATEPPAVKLILWKEKRGRRRAR